VISEKTALEYLNTAREHVKNHDYKGAFLRFIRAGCFFRESSDLVNSFERYNRTLQIADWLNSKEYKALVYSGFASYHRGTGDSNKFVQYLSESVKMHVSAAEELLARNPKPPSLIGSAVSEYSWASFCSFLLGEKELSESLAKKVVELSKTKRLRIWVRELAKSCESLISGRLEKAKTHWRKFQEKLSSSYLGETQYYEYVRIVENCFSIAKSGGKRCEPPLAV